MIPVCLAARGPPQALKLAKRTGFKDPKEIAKTANKFMSFFKPKTGASSSPAKGGRGASMEPSNPPPQDAGAAQLAAAGGRLEAPAHPSAAAGASAAGAGTPPAATAAKTERGYWDLFLKPSSDNCQT